MWCYWEHLGEHIEKMKTKKTPPQCMSSHLIGLVEILVLKLAITINKYYLTSEHCFSLVDHNNSSRWFAISSPRPICCPSLDFIISGC